MKRNRKHSVYLWLCADSMMEMARYRRIEREHEKDGTVFRGFG